MIASSALVGPAAAATRADEGTNLVVRQDWRGLGDDLWRGHLGGRVLCDDAFVDRPAIERSDRPVVGGDATGLGRATVGGEVVAEPTDAARV